jgi:hypothetical protein
MAALGAPLRQSSCKRGSFMKTEMRIVAGTPAQRCEWNKETERGKSKAPLRRVQGASERSSTNQPILEALLGGPTPKTTLISDECPE